LKGKASYKKPTEKSNEFQKKYPNTINKDFRFSIPADAVDILKIDRSQGISYKLTPDYKEMNFVVSFFDPIAKTYSKFTVKTPTNTKVEKQKMKSMVIESYKKVKAEHSKKIKKMELDEKEQVKRNIGMIKEKVEKSVISSINSGGDSDFPPGAKLEISPKIHIVGGKKYVDPKIYVMTVTYKDGLAEPEVARNVIIPAVEKFNNHAHAGLLLEYDINRSMSPKLRGWIIKQYGKESKYLKPYIFQFENF